MDPFSLIPPPNLAPRGEGRRESSISFTKPSLPPKTCEFAYPHAIQQGRRHITATGSHPTPYPIPGADTSKISRPSVATTTIRMSRPGALLPYSERHTNTRTHRHAYTHRHTLAVRGTTPRRAPCLRCLLTDWGLGCGKVNHFEAPFFFSTIRNRGFRRFQNPPKNRLRASFSSERTTGDTFSDRGNFFFLFFTLPLRLESNSSPRQLFFLLLLRSALVIRGRCCWTLPKGTDAGQTRSRFRASAIWSIRPRRRRGRPPVEGRKKNSSTLRHPRGHRDDDPHAFRPPNPVPGTHTHTHAHGTRFRAIPGNVLIRIFRPDHSFNSRFAFATFVRHSSQMPNFCSIWLKFQNRESGRAGEPKAAGRSLFCGGPPMEKSNQTRGVSLAIGARLK